jgi:hypothetical protein
MNICRAALLVIAALIAAAPAYAADELDMTEFGCRIVNKPGQRETETIQRIVLPWLEGYYHHTVISLARLAKDTKALQDYCAMHDGDTVMDGAATFMDQE